MATNRLRTVITKLEPTAFMTNNSRGKYICLIIAEFCVSEAMALFKLRAKKLQVRTPSMTHRGYLSSGLFAMIMNNK